MLCARGRCPKQLPATELVSTPHPASPTQPAPGCFLSLPAILGSQFLNAGVSDKEVVGTFCQEGYFFLPNKPGEKKLYFMALGFQKIEEFFSGGLIDGTVQFSDSPWQTPLASGPVIAIVTDRLLSRVLLTCRAVPTNQHGMKVLSQTRPEIRSTACPEFPSFGSNIKPKFLLRLMSWKHWFPWNLEVALSSPRRYPHRSLMSTECNSFLVLVRHFGCVMIWLQHNTAKEHINQSPV